MTAGILRVLLLVLAGVSCVGDEAALPSHPDAVRLLREAAARLRQLDAPAARELLQQAIALEGPNALLHAYLADALSMLGFEDEAREEIVLADAEAQGLPRRTRDYVRAVRLEHETQRAGAVELLRPLWDRGEASAGVLPTRDDLGLRLAELYAWTFQEEAARTLLATLRERLPEDPRVALVEGRVERNSGSFQHEREAFGRAAELARRQDAPLVLARALLLEAQAWQGQGALEETEVRLAESREIYRAHGHVRGEADTLLVHGNLYLERADLRLAKEAYEEGVRKLGAIGSRRLQTRILANLGEALLTNGDVDAAIQIFQQVLEHLEQLDDGMAQQYILRMLAEALTGRGRFDEAETYYLSALEMLRKAPEPGIEGATLSSYGWYLTERGDLAGAKRHLAEALAIQDEIGDGPNRAWTIYRRARILHREGAFEGALRGYEEAMEIFEQGGGDSLVAMVRSAQGETLLSLGHLDAADRSLRAALAVQDTLINPLPAADTRLSLAALLLEQGRPAEAESEADRVLADLAQIAVPEVSRAHALRARSLAAQGRTDTAEE